MGTRTGVIRMFMLICLCIFEVSDAVAAGPTKISVFNFSTANLEASGYGTTVTNMLLNHLKSAPALALLERKELEAFLSLNDLQQDENLENVVQIGTRLGLNVIVTGNVEKRGPLIVINCKVIQVEQKKVLLESQGRSLGDAGLGSEISRLATLVNTAIAGAQSKSAEADSPALKGPVNVQKRSGNMRVHLNWENDPETAASGYEIFRALSEAGPFARIAQVAVPEYADQAVERNTTYFYKIRSFTAKGQQSAFSSVISAETALTPNPPIILKTDRRIRSIQVTWSPAPISSDDPLRLKGYKLYRAKVEKGPYREVGNILGKDLTIGVDAGTAIDKIFKITYTDKGLADGEDYYYRLTAYNEKNLESDFCAPIKGITLPTVSGLKVQGNLIREARLSWDAIDSPVIRGYFVYRSTTEQSGYAKIKRIDTSIMGGEKTILYTDAEGLGDNTRYYYRVTALEDGDTETSPSVTVSALTRGKPQTPQGFTARSGLVKKVDLAWTASADDDVEGYKIYSSGEKTGKLLLLKKIEGRTNNKYTDESRGFEKLTDNATLYYLIVSYNKVDVESESSARIAATTKARPRKPSGFAGEGLRVNEVPLRWEPNPESDVAAYHIYRGVSSDAGEFSRLTKVQDATAYTDKGLKEGMTYRYRLQVEDRDGLLSDYSDTVAVKTKPKPGPPQGLSGGFRDGKGELRWTKENTPDFTHYTIYEKKFLGLEKIASVKEALFNDSGLGKGKSKTYVVTVTDKDGLESDPSSEITVTAGN